MLLADGSCPLLRRMIQANPFYVESLGHKLKQSIVDCNIRMASSRQRAVFGAVRGECWSG